MYIYILLLRITDTVTSKDIDLSSWDILHNVSSWNYETEEEDRHGVIYIIEREIEILTKFLSENQNTSSDGCKRIIIILEKYCLRIWI
jgi:hypothetical protein